jgi:hypothetical protein
MVQVIDVDTVNNGDSTFSKTFNFTRPSGYRTLSLFCWVSDDGGTNAVTLQMSTVSPASTVVWSTGIVQCPADAQCDLVGLHRNVPSSSGTNLTIAQPSTGFDLMIQTISEAHANEYKACALHSIK